jgi:hypothetical protein
MHCKLNQLESEFFLYVLACQGNGDAAMRDKLELLKQKQKVETSTHDHA